ncbi:hypothetical protein SAMD00019534_108760 [Acytostelium subglobosum LB1]|uniref:hypothetical protein n=1 Tax=Acytostelium subglobosum LB1 TaxID=1410327 RepID=UPI000644A4F0|nr:hypothetical protein SAMD00019534_108760 [Acytostelium subglobosum LB1]GAM27700.1 hypothetical protein SAMD00019534_108760 [Acytostelium subglobosum LB1]|eukprot:XP_012749359.1 hypothetical protein SAMD00019534_108760 [Acytostelium subglobosum LB1]
MDQVKTAINSTINEINDINHIINMVHPPADNATVVDEENDITQVIESIASCTSINQFINNQFTNVDADSDNDKNNRLSDDELMAMIIRHTQIVNGQESLDSLSLRYPSYRIDVDKLDDVKKQIESCFYLVQSASPSLPSSAALTPSKFDGQIISMRERECSMLSLSKSRWTSNNKTTKNPLGHICTSVVYARGNVYVFGGNATPTYNRFSLSEERWYDAPIVGVDGGYLVSAFYDGDNHIYLVGGFNESGADQDYRFLSRVDRFDLGTQRFTHVGDLEFGLWRPYTYLHNKDTIIVVGGWRSGMAHRDVLSFNLQTKLTDVLYKGVIDEHASCCFDPDGNCFYILAIDSFKRYDLSTQVNRQSTVLAKCPTFAIRCPLVHDGSFGIIYLYGAGNNYRYSTQDNKWTLIKDNDNVVSRSNYGACLIKQ